VIKVFETGRGQVLGEASGAYRDATSRADSDLWPNVEHGIQSGGPRFDREDSFSGSEKEIEISSSSTNLRSFGARSPIGIAVKRCRDTSSLSLTDQSAAIMRQDDERRISRRSFIQVCKH
jgi:hypothetical protein